MLSIFRTAASAADAGIAPRVPGSMTTVNIVVDQASFEQQLSRLGWLSPDDINAAATDLAERHCDTDTGIAIHPIDAVHAAVAGRIRRLVVDPTGVIINQGRKQRLFTGPIRDAIHTLTTHCGHPGCTVPSRHCQIDHLHEWGHGGRTNSDNADIDCGPHNRLKHRGYTITRHTRGVRWVRPDGTSITAIGQRPQPESDQLNQAARNRLATWIDERDHPDQHDQQPRAG
jgi:hypothetical protein